MFGMLPFERNNDNVFDTFDNFTRNFFQSSNANLPAFRTDIRDAGEMERVFASEPVDGVIHLAAYAGVRPSIQQPLLYTDVNINGTLVLLDTLQKHQVKRLVFASSSSVFWMMAMSIRFLYPVWK